ncbi:MAG: flagellar protein [Clostridiales bacterium]|nr:flagellar protein [Clostridiales bacterium]
MDDMRLKFYNPVVSGTPRTQPAVGTSKDAEGSDKGSFQSMLTEAIRQNSEVNFSKHAVKRVAEHNIELNGDNLNRLNEGVKIANDKKLEEPLILVGSTAFLVNIPNNTVITAVDSSNMKGNVFTNIDGTVII